MSKVLEDVKEVSFYELFDKKAVYVIPNYQRPYAWGDKQIEDFITDIRVAFESFDNTGSYLFGNIYLAKINNEEDIQKYLADETRGIFDECGFPLYSNDNEVDIFLIIDGQQRITTFYMLLKHLNEPLDDIKIDNCDVEIPRLILGELDNEFFHKLLKENNPQEHQEHPQEHTLSNKRLRIAYNILEDFAKNFSSKESSFKKFIKNNLKVIKSEVSDMKYAVLLFTTQTDRGKELTYIERLKSLLEFYSYNKLGGSLSNDINSTFNRVFLIMERVISEEVYKDEREFEDYFFKIIEILRVLDESDGNLRNARRAKPEEVYDGIRRKLRSMTEPENIEQSIKRNLDVIGSIVSLFEHIVGNIDHKDFKRIFKILKPGPMSYAFMVRFKQLYKGVDFKDKNFDWELTYNERILDKIDRWIKYWDEEKKERRCENFDDIFDQLKQTISSFKEELKNKSSCRISVLDFVELMELSIWKAHKEPVESFRNGWRRAFNSESPRGVFNAFNELVEYYKSNYIFDGDIIRYILMEYERIEFSNEEIVDIITSEEPKLEIEHIFASEAFDDKENLLSSYGFSDQMDYRDFSEKWGNKIFLEKGLNSKVREKLPQDKAQDYMEFCQQNRTKVKSLCPLGKDLDSIDDKADKQPTPSYRCYLELRDVLLKAFTYRRFPC